MKADIESTVRKRKSIRAYEPRPLTEEDKVKVQSLITEILSDLSPFPAGMKIHLLEEGGSADTLKLGTYGVIRGARSFLCVTAENTDTAMEAVGYHFERLVLAATDLGLGTCWLAGTFNREQFSGALEMSEGEIFPIVCPIGYPLDKQTFIGSIFRKVGKSDQRKDRTELFFETKFGSPLTPEQAGSYDFPLEMLRLAPSAANRQPWRVVHQNGAFHFFREANPKSKYGYDLQRLDVGIGACHFHLAVKEKGLSGRFERLPDVFAAQPDNMKYLFSWVTD